MWINRTFTKIFPKKNEDKERIQRCPHKDLKDCDYPHDYHECPHDKKDCLNKKNKKQEKKDAFKRNSVWLIIAIAILGLFISTIGLANPAWTVDSDTFLKLLEGISVSLIAGALFSIVFDIPKRLKDYQDAIVEAVTSETYLKRMDNAKLTKLRKEVTTQLHTKGIVHKIQGLIEIDQQICNLLTGCYYEWFRQSIISNKVTVGIGNDNQNYIEKENTITYKLVNPYGKNRKAQETLKHIQWIMVESEKKSEDYISNPELYISIDGGKEKKYESAKWKFNPLDKKQEYYNQKGQLYNGETEGIIIEFDDNIIVKEYFKVIVPIKDICFSKRLRYPALNFILNYTHNVDNTKLYGQIFGSNIKQTNVNCTYMADNSIILESLDILLPENGAIVIISDKT